MGRLKSHKYSLVYTIQVKVDLFVLPFFKNLKRVSSVNVANGLLAEDPIKLIKI